jgi:hypothetical protein
MTGVTERFEETRVDAGAEDGSRHQPAQHVDRFVVGAARHQRVHRAVERQVRAEVGR